MADLAAQREARRRKLAMNAEARMNRLLGKTSSAGDSDGERTKDFSEVSPSPQMPSTDDSFKENDGSPYNLRSRTAIPPRSPLITANGDDESVTTQKNAYVPYEVVEDPEVPDLGEFLAKREADKAAQVKSKQQSSLSSKKGWTVEQYTEIIKITGFIFTAFASRYALVTNSFGLLFQSIFLPFLLFELTTHYFIKFHLQSVSSSVPKGSMLSSALVLCGIRPELINVYNGIMNTVTLITTDFFTYVFIFIVIHACAG